MYYNPVLFTISFSTTQVHCQVSPELKLYYIVQLCKTLLLFFCRTGKPHSLSLHLYIRCKIMFCHQLWIFSWQTCSVQTPRFLNRIKNTLYCLALQIWKVACKFEHWNGMNRAAAAVYILCADWTQHPIPKQLSFFFFIHCYCMKSPHRTQSQS